MRKQFRPRNMFRSMVTIAGLALLTAAAAGQEPALPEPAAEAATPAAKPAVPDASLPFEHQPSMLYLPDKDGNLRPVPGFGLEELIELYEVKNGIEEQGRPPAYSIAEISFSGAADGPRAELAVDFTIAIHTPGWVRVPLRLANSMLGEPAKYDGPGEHLVNVAKDGSGYEVWIRSEPDTTHRVTLRLVTPIEQIGSESRLRLNVARAPVARLELRVPLKRAVANVSDGSTLVAVKPAAGDATQLSAIGLTGEFELTWQAADTPVARLPTVLEATGAITLRIDGRSINSEAKLTVRSSGGEFDSFRVRLPPGAELMPSTPGAVTVAVISTDDERGTICEVKLARKSSAPVNLRLETQRAIAAPQGDAPLELAGFEIIDAVRQSGTISVQVAGDWQIQWSEMRHVRQTDDLVGLIVGDDPTSLFEYAAQPFSLTARIMPQETRRRVEADYVVLVGNNEAELRARLKFTVRGAKVRTLEVDAPGWNVDVIGPANLVNVDAVIAGQNNPLVIPLLQASSGELEVTFEARQDVAADAAKLALRLPVPRGESVAAANVTIVPADNVELLIDPDKSTDLAPQPVRPKTLDLPERQQELLYFRTAGDTPTVVANVKVHRQEIAAALSGQIEVDEQSALVDARLVYQISYEPTDHLLLGVPRALRPDQISLSLDGQRLTPVSRRAGDASETSAVVPLRVSLPAPRIGRCELQVKYSVPHEQLADEANTLVNVPLVIPSEGSLLSNELTVVSKPGLLVTYPKGPWSNETPRLRSPVSSDLHLTASSAFSNVDLAVSLKRRQLDHNTTIEQAWIETRLTDTRRQDRAVFRLTTTEPTLRVLLPEGAELASLELDGRRLGEQIDLAGDSRELTLTMPNGSNAQHLLEVRYVFNQRPARGELALAAPQISPGGWVQQLYWQLVLPASEHVLGAPPSYAREFRWNWTNLFWSRDPSLNQRDLERWIGAAPASSQVRVAETADADKSRPLRGDAETGNYYLYSTVGAAEPLRLYTISRARLVLLASLPLLLCGLVLIYWPKARHPASLLVAAVAVAAVGAIDPESAVLLAQAASLGLVLAVMAFILARVSVRPSVAPAAPVRGSSQSLDRSFTEAFQRPAASGSQPSTATNPLVPSTAPESPP